MTILEKDLFLKSHTNHSSNPPLPHNQFPKAKHTGYLQLIWTIKRELKSPLLKLHLNVGTSWNFYLLLISDSIITKRKFKLVTIDEKNSPPGLDGSMKNIMPHLSKWANELARMITTPFFIHRKSHLGQPRVPTHYFPNLLAGTLWDCPTLWSTAISWGQMTSLFVFYTTWNKVF